MSRLNPARGLARGLGCLLTKPKTKVMVPILTQTFNKKQLNCLLIVHFLALKLHLLL